MKLATKIPMSISYIIYQLSLESISIHIFLTDHMYLLNRSKQDRDQIHFSHQELATKIRHKVIGCISVIRVSTDMALFSHNSKFIQNFGE